MNSLEIASGHDGVLHLKPDPVLIVGLYLRFGPTLQTIGRTVHRFSAKRTFPSVALTDHPDLSACDVSLREPPQFVALALALEEDGGGDVKRLYGALEYHSDLMVWRPDAVDLLSMPEAVDWRRPRPVQLYVENQATSKTCRSDKWIGACCWVMEGREARSGVALRLPFRSDDRRNDWTALITVHH